eukprot:scaffold22737_cov31-Phaeocystis_antarctica.AAC.1
MQALLQQEREQAAAREAHQRSLLEVAGKGAAAAAWEQAKREHERVLSEAEAHASQLSSQHEAPHAASHGLQPHAPSLHPHAPSLQPVRIPGGARLVALTEGRSARPPARGV